MSASFDGGRDKIALDEDVKSRCTKSKRSDRSEADAAASAPKANGRCSMAMKERIEVVVGLAFTVTTNAFIAGSPIPKVASQPDSRMCRLCGCKDDQLDPVQQHAGRRAYMYWAKPPSPDSGITLRLTLQKQSSRSGRGYL